MKVEINNTGDVIATVPWEYISKDQGERKLTLDCQKGFLPIHVHSYSEVNNGNSRIWRREEIHVDDSLLVGDVWMPVKIRDVISSSSFHDDTKANVHTTVVDSISIGKVQDSDLSFIFPPGTEVTDAIASQRYTISPTGEKTNVQLIVTPTLRKNKP